MSPALPATFDDITLAWFSAALRAGGKVTATVASIEVEPLDPSKGLIGDLARVHTTYEETALVGNAASPASFIVKLPAANPGSREIGLMLNAYGREVAFYQDLAPQLGALQVPLCFFAREHTEAQRWVLILQDCPADEFDFFAGATNNQARAAIDALADFHAFGWQRSAIDWMPGFDASGVGGLQPLWLNNLPVFLERYAALIPGEAGEWIQAFAPHLSEWSQRAATEPLTIVHADYRIDNLLFDGDSVTMIDWQTAMRAPAAMDVSCFISTSLTINDRRRLEPDLIDRYLDRLTAAGIAVDRAWFLKSYDENLLWWMGQFGNNLAHLDPGDDRVQAGLDAMVARVCTAALDRDAGRLLTSD